jgi:hypothetical protein
MFGLVITKYEKDICALTVKSDADIEVAKLHEPAAWHAHLLTLRELARMYETNNDVEIARLSGKMIDNGVGYWRVALAGTREQATLPHTGLLIERGGKLQFVPWKPSSPEAILASLGDLD